MLELIDTGKLKKKFGLLLSKLYTDNNLSINEINEVIIQSDYFDFLERQNPKQFLDDSYEMIAKNIFHKDTVFSKDTYSELFWAGEMYVTICLNKQIPLRQIFLMCPLNKMISYYQIYHEMNESKLVNQFMAEDYQVSILKKLRKRANITIKELSLVTGISTSTLNYYEINSNLYNGSFENLNIIANTLNCSTTYFLRRSSFVPYASVFFSNKELFKNLSTYLDKFYGDSIGKYIFDGILLQRTIGSKSAYVNELYLKTAITSLISNYSDEGKLLF